MSFLIFIVSIAALVVALKALRYSKPRPGQPTPAERIASLEERVRDLLFRVWTLEKQTGAQQQTVDHQVAEQQAGGAQAAPGIAAPSEPYVQPSPDPAVPEAEPTLPPAWSATEAGGRDAIVEAASPMPAPEPVSATAAPTRLNLAQRVGPRVTPGVGAGGILFPAPLPGQRSLVSDL